MNGLRRLFNRKLLTWYESRGEHQSVLDVFLLLNRDRLTDDGIAAELLELVERRHGSDRNRRVGDEYLKLLDDRQLYRLIMGDTTPPALKPRIVNWLIERWEQGLAQVSLTRLIDLLDKVDRKGLEEGALRVFEYCIEHNTRVSRIATNYIHTRCRLEQDMYALNNDPHFEKLFRLYPPAEEQFVQELLETGQPDQAFAKAARLADVQKPSLRRRRLLANAQVQSGRLEPGFREYEQLFAATPGNRALASEFVTGLLRANSLRSGAQFFLERARDKPWKNVLGVELLGALAGQRLREEALLVADHIKDSIHSSPEQTLQYAQVLMDAGETDMALAEMEFLMGRTRVPAGNITDQFISFNVKAGRYRTALEWLERRHGREPDPDKVTEQQAKLLTQLCEFPRARRCYEILLGRTNDPRYSLALAELNVFTRDSVATGLSLYRIYLRPRRLSRVEAHAECIAFLLRAGAVYEAMDLLLRLLVFSRTDWRIVDLSITVVQQLRLAEMAGAQYLQNPLRRLLSPQQNATILSMLDRPALARREYLGAPRWRMHLARISALLGRRNRGSPGDIRETLLGGGFVRLGDVSQPMLTESNFYVGRSDETVDAFLERDFDYSLLTSAVNTSQRITIHIEQQSSTSPLTRQDFNADRDAMVDIRSVEDANAYYKPTTEDRIYEWAAATAHDLVSAYLEMLGSDQSICRDKMAIQQYELIVEDVLVGRLRLLDRFIDEVQMSHGDTLLFGLGTTKVLRPVVDWARQNMQIRNVYVCMKGGLRDSTDAAREQRRLEDRRPEVDPTVIMRVVSTHFDLLRTTFTGLHRNSVMLLGSIFNKGYAAALFNMITSLVSWTNVNMFSLYARTEEVDQFRERINPTNGTYQARVVGLSNAGIFADNFKHDVVDIKREAKRAIDEWLSTTLRQKPAIYREINISSAILPVLIHTLAFKVPQAFAFIKWLRQFYSTHAPSAVVVSPGRHWQARLAVTEARRAGLRTVDVQGLMVARAHRYKAPLAEVVTVLDSYQKRIYQEFFSMDPGRIRVVGYPGMDTCSVAGTESVRSSALRAVGLPLETRQIVLYAAQPENLQQGEATIEAIVKACAGVRGCGLIVKLHPRQNMSIVDHLSAYVSQMTGGNCPAVVVRDENLYKLIASADLVITKFSNAGLEAAIMGKPVVAINLFNEPRAIDLAEIGVAVAAETEEELKRRVMELLSDPVARREILARQEKYFGENRHLRSTRAADTLSGIIRDLSTQAPGRRELA